MNARGIIEKAAYDYEAKLGAFLASGRELSDIRARAQAYLHGTSPQVRDLAVGIEGKVSGLLSEFQSIHASALEAAKTAADLKARMDSDPKWRAILSADWSNFGYETVKQARLMIGQATSAAAELATVNNRINQFLKSLEGARADMGRLDAAASGRALPSAGQILSGIGGGLSRTLTLAALAGVALYVGVPALAKVARGRG